MNEMYPEGWNAAQARAREAMHNTTAPLPGAVAGYDRPILPVDLAVAQVRAEIEPVAKSQRSQGQGNYSYRGRDAVVDALAPIMARWGVAVVPSGVRDLTTEWVTDAKGRVERLIGAFYAFDVRGPAGDSYRIELYAEGMNSRDKASGTATSYAYRYALEIVFSLPTEAHDVEEATDTGTAGPMPEPESWAYAYGWSFEEAHDERRAAVAARIKALQGNALARAKVALAKVCWPDPADGTRKCFWVPTESASPAGPGRMAPRFPANVLDEIEGVLHDCEATPEPADEDADRAETEAMAPSVDALQRLIERQKDRGSRAAELLAAANAEHDGVPFVDLDELFSGEHGAGWRIWALDWLTGVDEHQGALTDTEPSPAVANVVELGKAMTAAEIDVPTLVAWLVANEPDVKVPTGATLGTTTRSAWGRWCDEHRELTLRAIEWCRAVAASSATLADAGA